MKLFIDDVKRMPRLLAGLITLASGIYLTKISLLGLAPWGVFHDGLAQTTGIGFGFITQIVGVIVLIISLLRFRTKVGLGTILNVAIVGPIIELLQLIQGDLDSSLWIRILVFLGGFLLMTFGRSLYISSELGQGPRDGLFVGIARVTKFQVKHIKPAIEFTVLVTGFLLGGNFYIGTIFIVICSGYFVQFFFSILHYEPKTSRQNNSVFDYFK